MIRIRSGTLLRSHTTPPDAPPCPMRTLPVRQPTLAPWRPSPTPRSSSPRIVAPGAPGSRPTTRPFRAPGSSCGSLAARRTWRPRAPRLRGGDRGGPVLRLGGQHGRPGGRRPRQAVLRAAQATQRVGGHQQGARRAAPRRGSHGARGHHRRGAGEGRRLVDDPRLLRPLEVPDDLAAALAARPPATANFAAFPRSRAR